MQHRVPPIRAAIAARVACALLVVAAGAIHLWLYFDFFHRVHVIGVLFLLNAAAAFGVGGLLLVSGRELALLSGLAYSAGTLAAFFASVYHGLFGYVESLRGPWQEAAAGVELSALLLLIPLLGSRRRFVSNGTRAPKTTAARLP